MEILLTTANARYFHCAFGLRRLEASLRVAGYHPHVHEFTIQQSPFEIAEALLVLQPQVIGFGVYIWNVELLNHVAEILHAVSPGIVLIFGGPEMLGETEESLYLNVVDYVIRGEGERALTELIRQLDAGSKPKKGIIDASPPDLEELPSPYDLYTDEDIRNRIVYVESSRGCPYRCTFCLSSRDERVRYFSLDSFLAAMRVLLDRGVRLFKFTDRTFNTDERRVLEIMDFFLEQSSGDTQLHFEIMPDRISPAVLEKIATFPCLALHLELGVQSFSQEVQRRIRRNQNIERTMETIDFLRNNTGAALHADLIVGLPGEDTTSVAIGFDALVNSGVQEIQVGLLKRLKGTPLADESDAGSAFDATPPYEVLQTQHLSFSDIQGMKRFARYFDLYYNHGNFSKSLELLWQTNPSPFHAFEEFASYIWQKEKRTHGLPLAQLAKLLFSFLHYKGLNRELAAHTIEMEFRRLPGRKDVLDLLQ